MTLDKARVLVTGGTGFLGQYVLDVLDQMGAKAMGLSSDDVDLRDPLETIHVFNRIEPQYVFHLAGYNGGIAFNAKEPARIFADNTMMALNVMEACRHHKVTKVVSVVASCAYPAEQDEYYDNVCDGREAYVQGPRDTCPEYDFFDGPTHRSVACHGYAKRNLQLASKFYAKQYGLNAVCACPTTLYGPGDSFDPERTKVMAAMVKRFVDAVDENADDVTVWGSGKPMREFLYVEDAAKLLVSTMEHYDDNTLPLNLGTGQELSIMDLAEQVADAAGFKGTIFFDTDKPDGQHRKRLDTTRMNEILPPWAATPLDEGIRKTVDYYRGLKHARLAG